MGNNITPPGKGDDFGGNYAGDVTSLEAWEVLLSNADAQLVDVRTVPEWSFVGFPVLSGIGKEAKFISWRVYPSMAVNGDFINQLQKTVADKESPIFFLCRSGHRSLDAAIEATRYGYKHCYNIADGFEGVVDENAHRNVINGWKAANLPWGQN